MRSRGSLFIVIVAFLAISATLGSTAKVSIANATPAASVQNDKPGGNSLVYADFEKVENGRPVSNGGGQIQIYGSQESTPVHFKGMANASPGAPELVKLKGEDSNHLATFDYALTAPNQWANVTLEVTGHPFQADGKSIADDVSSYKSLSVQLYATGTDALRVEFNSHGQGVNVSGGPPQMSVKIRPGLNTYLIPLKSISQPSWVETKIDPKEVLKKLTSVSVSPYCNQCLPQRGTVIVDNIIFQK